MTFEVHLEDRSPTFSTFYTGLMSAELLFVVQYSQFTISLVYTAVTSAKWVDVDVDVEEEEEDNKLCSCGQLCI